MLDLLQGQVGNLIRIGFGRKSIHILLSNLLRSWNNLSEHDGMPSIAASTRLYFPLISERFPNPSQYNIDQGNPQRNIGSKSVLIVILIIFL
jgi:hypothetical protein